MASGPLPVLLLGALLSAAIASAQGEPLSLTLEETVAKALARAPAVVEAEANRRVGEAARRRASAVFLYPQASASVNATVNSSERFNTATSTTESGSAFALNGSLAASYDLYAGGRQEAERDRAIAALKATTATLEEQKRQARLLATRAFFEAARAERLAAVAGARKGRAEVGLTAAERREGLGSGTKSDVLRAQLEVSSARIAELTARQTQEERELELGRLCGVDGKVRPVRALEEPNPSRVSLENALKDSPRLLQLSADTEAAVASTRIARGAYLPTLRLSAGYDWFGTPPSIFPGRTAWTVRLGLAYAIFDGFQRDETFERARAREAILASQADEAQRSLRLGVLAADSRLSLAVERRALTAQAVNVAREDLRVQQERYSLGVSTMLELLTSQENLAQAESDATVALFEEKLLEADRAALTGLAEATP